jgi:hypothetical protein
MGITLFRQGKLVEASLCYQECLSIGREMGDKFSQSLLHCYVGLLALVQNQPEAARSSFVEGLSLAYQNDVKIYAVYNLIGMAGLFQHQGEFREAVILLAASDQIAKSVGLKIEPELQEPYDKVLAETRQRLKDSEFQSAWEIGEKMDLEQAVKFALES